MPQVIDRPQTIAAPALPKLQFITHPHSTFANVVSDRYKVQARLFDGSYATDTLREFDVLVPAHLGNAGIERLIKSVTGQRYQVQSKALQTCSAF